MNDVKSCQEKYLAEKKKILKLNNFCLLFQWQYLKISSFGVNSVAYFTFYLTVLCYNMVAVFPRWINNSLLSHRQNSKNKQHLTMICRCGHLLLFSLWFISRPWTTSLITAIHLAALYWINASFFPSFGKKLKCWTIDCELIVFHWMFCLSWK